MSLRKIAFQCLCASLIYICSVISLDPMFKVSSAAVADHFMLGGSKFIVWRHEGEAVDWGGVGGQREMGSYYQ